MCHTTTSAQVQNKEREKKTQNKIKKNMKNLNLKV